MNTVNKVSSPNTPQKKEVPIPGAPPEEKDKPTDNQSQTDNKTRPNTPFPL